MSEVILVDEDWYYQPKLEHPPFDDITLHANLDKWEDPSQERFRFLKLRSLRSYELLVIYGGGFHQLGLCPRHQQEWNF